MHGDDRSGHTVEDATGKAVVVGDTGPAHLAAAVAHRSSRCSRPRCRDGDGATRIRELGVRA